MKIINPFGNIPFFRNKVILSFFGLLALFTVYKIFTFGAGTEAEKEQSNFNRDYRIYAINIPSELAFAGEEVPLYDPDVHQKLDREILVNTYWQSHTLLYIKRARKYLPQITRILKAHNIPEDFKYVPLVESGFTNVVSPAGAAGYWQFMESTAKEYGLEVNDEVDERYHLKKATEAACKYIKKAYEKFGSWTLAAASFNMGMNGVERTLERQKLRSYYDLYLNPETSRYIFRILALKEILREPRKYGFHFDAEDLYYPSEKHVVRVDTSIKDWVHFAFSHGITYKALKLHNPWIRGRELENPEQKAYQVAIPDKVYFDSLNVANKKEFRELVSANGRPVKGSSNERNPGEFVFHSVKEGESLESIAREYQVRVSELMQWNDLNTRYVETGRKLRILKSGKN